MADIASDPAQTSVPDNPLTDPVISAPGSQVGAFSVQQLQAQGLDPNQIESAGMFSAQTPVIDREKNAEDFAKFGVPSAVAGFIDTVGTSVGLMDDADLTNTLKEHLPDMGAYYRDNREGARLAGDLVGMFIPGLVFTKAIRSGSMLNSGLKALGFGKNKLLNSVFTSGQSYDRVLRAVRARDLYLAKRGQTDFSRLGDTRRRQFVNRAVKTKLLDTFKENMAFELGVLATMNSSEVLYPSEFEFVDHVALNSAFPAVFGAAEFMFMKKLIRQSAQSVGPIATAARNIADAPTEAFQSRPGARDVKAFYLAANKKGADDTITQATDETTLRNFKNESQQLEVELKREFTKMGTDKPLPGITNSRKVPEEELRTLLNGADSDPIDLLGILSVERLPPTTDEMVENFLGAQTREVKRTDGKINSLQAEINKRLDKGQDVTKLVKERTALQETKNELESAEFYVKETTGEIIPLSDYKPIVQNGERGIREVRRTANEPKMYAVDLIDGGSGAVTESFIPIIPGITDVKVNRVNVTKVLPDISKVRSGEDTRLLLKDMGADWHFRSGTRGADVFGSLPAEISDDISNWVGNSASSKLRQWVAEGDPRFQQLYQAYEPMRARLRELADPDGTIPLLRGESKAETAALNSFAKGGESAKGSRLNDVVSMTSSEKVASAFRTDNIVVRRVPVEDVIMIVGGAGQEFEFIVKGNTQRAFGETITTRNFNALGLTDRSKIYAAQQRAIEKFVPGKSERIQLHAGDHHTRIDAVLELHKKHGDEIFNSIQMPEGLTSIDDLQYLSLASKFEEYRDLRRFMNADFEGLLKLSDSQKLNHTDIARMLNLPIPKDGQVSPIALMFENFLAQGDTGFRGAVKSMDDFRDMIQTELFFPEVVKRVEGDIPLRGNMLDMPENARPVVLVKRPLSDSDVTREAVRNQAIANRQRTTALLATADQEGAELVKAIFDTIDSTQAKVSARQVGDLVEGAQRTKGAFTTQSFAAGENAAVRAASDINAVVVRQARIMFADKIEPHVQTFSKLRATNNETDLTMFNMYVHARRQQWDLAEDFVRNDDGTFSFKLMDTAFNRRKYNEIYGTNLEKIPEDALMPAPTGAKGEPIGLRVSELAMEGITAFRDIDSFIFKNMNHIRRVMGQSPMREKPWHVVPTNFYRKEVQFLVDETGQLKQIVNGRTEADAIRKAEREQALNPKLTRLNSDAVEKYFSLNDRGFEGLRDFSDIFLQTPKRATGKTVGNLVETGESVLNEMVDSLTKQMESVTRRTLLAYFEPEVQYAKHVHAASGVSKDTAQKGQSVWQNYISALTGNPTLNPNDIVGKTYFRIEELYDNFLDKLHDNAVLHFRPDQIDSVTATKGQDKVYRQLEKQLGEFNPFQSAVDMANRTEAGSLPPSMRTNMAKLSQFTSLLVLRFLDAGHAILNMTSLGATMPAVIKALNKLPEETTEQWSTRIGAYGLPVDGDIAQFSPVRLMMTTMHEMFQPQFQNIMKDAAKLGLFDQEVAEMMRTITAPRQGYVEGILSKFTNGASFLSDKSERLSRAISFASGYHLGTKGLGLSHENGLFFAHRFANDVIGDYRPANRPRIYQGAVGMPVGLFMTFMQNYYQRIFGYIENKQSAALVTQFATQASIFGASSVPGFDQFANFFYSNYDGSVNPVDGFDRTFGKDVSEWLLYGSISNLPKLFGADDGISLFTRGDVNFARVPGLFSLDQSPVVNMATQFKEALVKSVQSVRESGGFNTQQMLEIVANHSISRPIRGAAELFSGYATDKRGQVVNSEVRTAMGFATRAVGMRELSEAKRRDTYGRVRTTERSQRYRLNQMRSSLRSKLRSGEFDKEDLTRSLQKYMQYGGNPEYFARFLTQQIIASTVDRDARELMKAMKDPTRGFDVLRLISAFSLPQNDPEFSQIEGDR